MHGLLPCCREQKVWLPANQPTGFYGGSPVVQSGTASSVDSSTSTRTTTLGPVIAPRKKRPFSLRCLSPSAQELPSGAHCKDPGVAKSSPGKQVSGWPQGPNCQQSAQRDNSSPRQPLFYIGQSTHVQSQHDRLAYCRYRRPGGGRIVTAATTPLPKMWLKVHACTPHFEPVLSGFAGSRERSPRRKHLLNSPFRQKHVLVSFATLAFPEGDNTRLVRRSHVCDVMYVHTHKV